MFKKAVSEGKLHGIQIARKAPTISHLFFADDNLLFARANTVEADCIMDILHRYQMTSGQVVNLDKSEASFSRNMREDSRDMIRNRMGVKTVTSHLRYLGLQVVFGRSKQDIFELVKERVWKKMKGWKERFLSRDGKEILIKSVAQEIPSYIMSCYKLPEGCCQEIEGMIAKFWWGSKEGSRKIHWLSWDRMLCAKGEGGLGFRGIGEFNTSLLGKQYWSLLTGGDSLLSRVLKGRYFPRCSLENATIGFNPSFAWRSILSSKELVTMGSRWRIGDGEQVKIWRDNWLPQNPGFKPIRTDNNIDTEAKVSELIDYDLGGRIKDKVINMFNPLDANQILGIPLSLRHSVDKRIWHFEKNGEFSIRSAYHLLKHNGKSKKPGLSFLPYKKLWKFIWKAPVLPRVRNFLWRLAKNILPTKANLQAKGVSAEPLCSMCHAAAETADHLFMKCEFAKVVCFSSQLGYRIPQGGELNEWLLQILTEKVPFCSQVLCNIMWNLWQSRNNLLYNRKEADPLQVAEMAYNSAVEYNSSQQKTEDKDSRRKNSLMEPIPKGVSVVQVDAGVYSDGIITHGCVVKDQDKNIVMAASKKLMGSGDPCSAELMAIRWGLKIAKDLRLESILVQSDSTNAVDYINCVVSFASIDHITQDCRDLLSHFKFASVVYLSRCSLKEAHHMVGLEKM